VISLGVSSLVILAAATVLIWWPTSRGRFLMDPAQIVADWIESDEPLTLEQMYRDLALHYGDNAHSNRELIRSFFTWYIVGLVAFAGLVVALVLAVWEVT
jgi:hypothetical protein